MNQEPELLLEKVASMACKAAVKGNMRLSTEEAKAMIEEKGLNVDIQVDGGIDLNNVEKVIQAGANIIVAGSSVYNGDTAANTKAMMEILNKYE